MNYYDFNLYGDPSTSLYSYKSSEIGVWRSSTQCFYLDYSGDGLWQKPPAGDRVMGPFRLSNDVPVIGDWNNDSKDEIGVWRSSTKCFYLDYSGDGLWQKPPAGDRVMGPFGLSNDKPLSGRW